MITGTRQAIIPIPFHLLWIFPYAVNGLCFVFLPIATSVIRSVKPNVRARTMYMTRNIPPPSFAARYGNLHIFPSPTALPAAARTNPIDPLNEFLFVWFSIKHFSPVHFCMIHSTKESEKNQPIFSKYLQSIIDHDPTSVFCLLNLNLLWYIFFQLFTVADNANQFICSR